MTREELRKKRQEIAKNNGYSEYKSTHQMNQQPAEPKTSTWDKVMNIAKSMGTDVGNIGKNFGLGITSSVKNSGYYIQDMTENKFGDYRRYNQQQNAILNKREETEKLTKNQGNVNINDVKLPENPNQRQMVSEEESKKALLPQKQESRVLKSIDESIAKDEEKIQQNIDNSSNRVSKKLAELMPSIAQSVTGMGTSVVNPALGLGFWQTSAGGGYTREAEKNGYTGNDAMLYGTIMGSMESATEWIGAKLTAGVGKAFFKKSAVEGLKAFGLDVAENFLEEAVMEPIQETVKQAIGKDGDWQGIGSRMLQSGINGALTSIIMGGASAGIGSATNLITKAQNGGQITQKEIADTLKEINKSEEVDIEKILANNFNFTAEDLAVNTDARQRTEQRLENVAEGMSRNEAQQLLINESDLDDTQKEVLSEITNQYNLSDEDVKKAIQNTKDGKYNNLEQIEGTTTQNNEVLNQEQQTIQDENKMAQNETSQQPSEYTTNLMKSIDNYNNSRQEGQEIFDINNEETRKEIESIQKVAEKRGINITFDESRFDNTDTNAFYEYDEKGNVANIVLNPNSTSKKYVQNLVIHEMTHSFEGSKEYNNLSKAILDYAKKTGEYDKAFKDLKNTYSSVYKGNNIDSIVEKEAVANILGEKLGDKEFVDSLVNNQYVERNIIQKIIDFAKNQINRFKGYKDQEQYWNNIKNLYEEAYNKSEVSKEGLKQSIETNDKISTKDSQGRELSKGQQEYFKDVSPELKDENGNLKRFYHGTNSDFTVFDLSKGGQSNSGASIGFWFTETKEGAEKFANDVWYGDKKPNTKEVYLDIKNPKIYENVKNEEQEQFYKDKSEELEKKAKEIKKEYSWDNTDYKTSMTFNDLIREYQTAKYQKKNVDLDLFERLAKERGFNDEQIANMEKDAKEYDKTLKESKKAENEYYKLRYSDAYEQFKIDLYEVAGQSAEEANTGGLGMMLNNPKETVEKFRQKLMAEGYDGIIIKGTEFDRGSFNGNNNQYVIFNSNQAKNIDNTNPTENPDIRYSQDTTGAWNNFIEKYFKNEGEGTAIKDLKKLPTREYTIQDYEEVINNSANIPEADKKSILKDLEGIELNKQSLNDFKQEIERLDKNYAEYNQTQEQQRFENKNYKDEGRAELISKKRKEFSKNMNYNDTVVAELDEIIPRNRNGKRTVAQWKNMAKQLGQRIANLSPEQIEDIAVKSYYDLEPTKAITRYDNQSKTNVGYEQLYANDWVNEVYEGVRENRQFSMETENQENIEQPTSEVELPKAETPKVQTQKKENTILKENLNQAEKTTTKKETQEKVAQILTEPVAKQEKKSRVWAILKANILDKGMVFEDISKKTKNRELEAKWDYTLLSESIGQNAIGNNRYEFENGEQKQISKSLTSIIDEVGDKTADFQNYMYHLLNIDRMTLDSRMGIENKPVFR